MPNTRSIITGQRVSPVKVQRARELRRAMTPAEVALWERLRANRLDGFHFRRQQIVDGFIVDFYCHAAALVIEVDGPVHERQQDHDRERDAVLARRNLRILRFTNDQLEHDLDSAINEIKTYLTSAKSE